MNARMKLLTLDEFLEGNLISRDDWECSNIDWHQLKAIGIDHESRSQQLEETAQFLAKTLQRFDQVHSVRWRVKKASHLMAKIVRKKVENNVKYFDVNVENYADLITDLIGLRALHLFKSDCFAIDVDLRRELDLAEGPRAYVRVGDDQVLREQYQEVGFEVQDHPHGYRSIHYVVTAQPTKRKVFAEIQVRTIFEEGWSEIDHTVRYPNFSEDVQVAYLLQVFNRIAGSADELGGFVKTLKTVLDETQSMASDALDSARQAIVERDASIAKMEEAIDQLAKIQTGQQEQERISTVKHELAKLKVENSTVHSGASDLARALDKFGISADPRGVGSIAKRLNGFADPGGSLAMAKKLTGLGIGGISSPMAKTMKGLDGLSGSLAMAKISTGLGVGEGEFSIAKKLKKPRYGK